MRIGSLTGILNNTLKGLKTRPIAALPGFKKHPYPAFSFQARYRANWAAHTKMSIDKKAHAFTREAFEDVMRQRFFYTQAFEIYGGPSTWAFTSYAVADSIYDT